MSPRVAVLQFPGINSEYETLRALWDAGINANFFRWNQNPADLEAYDGFVIPGGFSYEDRGRSGLIASMDPIMQEIRRQAEAGKPVLGICNGAQILVESGLIPGNKNHELLMSLARNKRIKDGKVLGTGFYNENVFVRCEAPGRSVFTLDYDRMGDIEQVPVAHGEGRFTTTIPDLLEKLIENNQIVFRYCEKNGETNPDFPVNPNGAMHNAAAICNPQGNVMAIMPHPERAPTAPMPKIFSSMRAYMEARAENPSHQIPLAMPPLEFQAPSTALTDFVLPQGAHEFFVELKITDNEAGSLENALRGHGFAVKLRKWKYFELTGTPPAGTEDLLHNKNKEQLSTAIEKKPEARYYLSMEKDDIIGLKWTQALGLPTRHGILWEVLPDAGTPFDESALLSTRVFANPHAQDLFRA
ncbi:MAG: phosphoribosylformylglycinamidine synthase I [Candidatus Gracilibacteria bacterium]|jgi:phosphoribosylformylglycinamidine synthase